MKRLLARSTDPHTSHEGVISLPALREQYERILEIFQQHGPLAHSQALRIYRRLHGRKAISPSGFRTRVRELVDAERMVSNSTYHRMSSGRRSLQWVLV